MTDREPRVPGEPFQPTPRLPRQQTPNDFLVDHNAIAGSDESKSGFYLSDKSMKILFNIVDKIEERFQKGEEEGVKESERPLLDKYYKKSRNYYENSIISPAQRTAFVERTSFVEYAHPIDYKLLIVVPIPDTEPPITSEEAIDCMDAAMEDEEKRFASPRTEFVGEVTLDSTIKVTDELNQMAMLHEPTEIPEGHSLLIRTKNPDFQYDLIDRLQAIVDDREQQAE